MKPEPTPVEHETIHSIPLEPYQGSFSFLLLVVVPFLLSFVGFVLLKSFSSKFNPSISQFLNVLLFIFFMGSIVAVAPLMFWLRKKGRRKLLLGETLIQLVDESGKVRTKWIRDEIQASPGTFRIDSGRYSSQEGPLVAFGTEEVSFSVACVHGPGRWREEEDEPLDRYETDYILLGGEELFLTLIRAFGLEERWEVEEAL